MAPKRKKTAAKAAEEEAAAGEKEEAGLEAAAGPPAETKKKQKTADGPPQKKAKESETVVIERSLTPRPEKAEGLVLMHWNIAGLNGLLKSEERKKRFLSLLKSEQPDIIAISEHKLSQDKATAASQELTSICPDYKTHWALCTVKNGYSGIGVLVKRGIKACSFT